MKNVIFVLVVITLFSGCSSTIESLQNKIGLGEKKESLGHKLFESKDKDTGATLYRGKEVEMFSPTIRINADLIVEKDGKKIFYIHGQYAYTKTWIFFDEIQFSINGKGYRFKVDKDSKYKNTYSGGYVREEGNAYLKDNPEILEFLSEVMKTDDVSVRLAGEKVSDKELGSKDLENLREVYQLYMQLTN